MGLEAYIAVSAALFALGVVCIVTRRNVIYVLMGIEMILNAANINFVAFNRFGTGGIDGQMMAVFVIILAAAEAPVALQALVGRMAAKPMGRNGVDYDPSSPFYDPHDPRLSEATVDQMIRKIAAAGASNAAIRQLASLSRIKLIVNN